MELSQVQNCLECLQQEHMGKSGALPDTDSGVRGLGAPALALRPAAQTHTLQG